MSEIQTRSHKKIIYLYNKSSLFVKSRLKVCYKTLIKKLFKTLLILNNYKMCGNKWYIFKHSFYIKMGKCYTSRNLNVFYESII